MVVWRKEALGERGSGMSITWTDVVWLIIKCEVCNKKEISLSSWAWSLGGCSTCFRGGPVLSMGWVGFCSLYGEAGKLLEVNQEKSFDRSSLEIWHHDWIASGYKSAHSCHDNWFATYSRLFCRAYETLA